MKKRISVTIEETTYERLTKHVASTKPHVSQSAIVDQSISEYLESNKGETNGEETSTKRNQKTSTKKEVN